MTFSTVFIVTKSTGIERRKMTPEESFEIKKSKGYLVVKSNDLIQRNRFELSLPEQ